MPKEFDSPAQRQCFDVTATLKSVCVDIVKQVPDLAHIQMDRVAVSYSQARRETACGALAKLTPLRFEGGALTVLRNGQLWTIQQLFQGNQEQRYILSVYLPRFFDLSFEEKINTLVHELYHISPQFDGDIRRFPGRCFAHSSSHQVFDEAVDVLRRAYLKRRSTRSQLLHFLHNDFKSLRLKYGAIVGSQVPIPKLFPVRETRAA